MKRPRALAKLILRDIASPVLGLFIGYQQATGRIPFQYIWGTFPFAAALIGIPFWDRDDERERNGDEPRKRKGIRIQIGGDDE